MKLCQRYGFLSSSRYFKIDGFVLPSRSLEKQWKYVFKNTLDFKSMIDRWISRKSISAKVRFSSLLRNLICKTHISDINYNFQHIYNQVLPHRNTHFTEEAEEIDSHQQVPTTDTAIYICFEATQKPHSFSALFTLGTLGCSSWCSKNARHYRIRTRSTYNENEKAISRR